MILFNKSKKYLLLSLVLFLSFFCFFESKPVKSQNPQTEVTLTWSTNTYTPPGYPGKALPTRGSEIEVVANIDNPQATDIQNLIFNWFINGAIQKTALAQEGQIFKFNIGESLTKKKTIKLEIKNKKGQSVAKPSFLIIKARNSKIILKPKPPHYKTSDNIVRYEAKPNQKVVFTAKPYFFNIKKANELNYQWFLDKKLAEKKSSENPNIFTLNIGSISQNIQKELNLWAVNKNNKIQTAHSLAKILLES